MSFEGWYDSEIERLLPWGYHVEAEDDLALLVAEEGQEMPWSEAGMEEEESTMTTERVDERTQRPSIEVVWARIIAHQGQTFHQILGKAFTYEVDHGYLIPSTTNWRIPRGHFEEALELVPLENTVPVQHLYGPSYIFAVLMDRRIRGSDW
jgi:hypothetical protein